VREQPALVQHAEPLEELEVRPAHLPDELQVSLLAGHRAAGDMRADPHPETGRQLVPPLHELLGAGAHRDPVGRGLDHEGDRDAAAGRPVPAAVDGLGERELVRQRVGPDLLREHLAHARLLDRPQRRLHAVFAEARDRVVQARGGARPDHLQASEPACGLEVGRQQGARRRHEEVLDPLLEPHVAAEPLEQAVPRMLVAVHEARDDDAAGGVDPVAGVRGLGAGRPHGRDARAFDEHPAARMHAALGVDGVNLASGDQQ
jgi:hypothetical protein